MITEHEIKELARDYWDLVTSGVDGSEAEKFFINPGVLLASGEWMTLEAHQELHRALRDEHHDWLNLAVTVLSEDPERVLAQGTVHWESSFADGRDGIIKCDVGETWVIERGRDARIRWALYWSSALDLMDDSAEFAP